MGKALMLMLLPLAVAACSMMHDDAFDCPQEDSVLKNAWLSVTIRIGDNHTPATRGPQGGEDGDGREDAHANEYAINNVTLLLYRGGINDADATTTTIEHAFYFDALTNKDNTTDDQYDESYTTATIRIEEEIERASYKVLAIVNAGDMTSLKGEPLFGVRDKVLTQDLWTVGGEGSISNFVMSSEEESTIDFQTEGLGSAENPFKGEILVERMAARIDFDVAGGTFDETAYTYKYKVEGTENDYILLKSVQVKNVLTSGSYLFKRVSATADEASAVNYLGDETYTVEGSYHIANNFVIDPWTTQKKGGNVEGLTYTNGSNISMRKFDKTGSDSESYFILSYVRENTLPVGFENRDNYATALVFTYDYYKGGALTNDNKDKTKTYYLRHSDPNEYDDESTDHTMKYGVVRNNIYRVKVGKVNKVEDPVTPGDGVNISLQIKVKNWKLVEHPTIVM